MTIEQILAGMDREGWFEAFREKYTEQIKELMGNERLATLCTTMAEEYGLAKPSTVRNILMMGVCLGAEMGRCAQGTVERG